MSKWENNFTMTNLLLNELDAYLQKRAMAYLNNTIFVYAKNNSGGLVWASIRNIWEGVSSVRL
jgi:hypothetical protein